MLIVEVGIKLDKDFEYYDNRQDNYEKMKMSQKEQTQSQEPKA